MIGRVVFRVDALPFMGIGHLSRCLALAHELKEFGVHVHFACRDGADSASWLVEKQGFDLHRLPLSELPVDPTDTRQWLGRSVEADAEATLEHIRCIGRVDWLIVDHYSLDAEWERRLRPECRRILAIDDLANRFHDCDLLLDQNLREGNPYSLRLPPNATALLGPKYALLREEFVVERENLAPRSGKINRLLVFFGGSDPTGETIKVLEAFCSLRAPGLCLDVVVGMSNPQRIQVEAMCRQLPCATYHCQVENMAHLMAQADLAFGASGVSSWERLAVGLPAVVVAVADNQMEIMRQLHEAGLAIALGPAADVSSEDMLWALRACVRDPQSMQLMSRRGLATVDARGARRVALEMESLS